MPRIDVYLSDDKTSLYVEKAINTLKPSLKKLYGYDVRIIKVNNSTAALMALKEGVDELPAIKISGRIFKVVEAEKAVNLLLSGKSPDELLERKVSSEALKKRAENILRNAESMSISLESIAPQAGDVIKNIRNLESEIYESEFKELDLELREIEDALMRESKKFHKIKEVKSQAEDLYKQVLDGVSSLKEIISRTQIVKADALIRSLESEVINPSSCGEDASCLEKSIDMSRNLISKISSIRGDISSLEKPLLVLKRVIAGEFDDSAAWFDAEFKTSAFSDFIRRIKGKYADGIVFSSISDIDKVKKDLSLLDAMASGMEAGIIVRRSGVSLDKLITTIGNEASSIINIVRDDSIDLDEKMLAVSAFLSKHMRSLASVAEVMEEAKRMFPIWERYVSSLLESRNIVKVEELDRIPKQWREAVIDDMVEKKMAIRLPDGKVTGKLRKEVIESYKLEVGSRINKTFKIVSKMEIMGMNLAEQEKELRELLSKLETTDPSDVVSAYNVLIEIDKRLKEIENRLKEMVSR
ncbi:MAG: hypothetical protein C0200_03705 [Thermoproteota archaeon]|nr:MAG: hypothetical protein C0200_03705 [Candidatus Korarchaeota archaeon]